MKVIRIHAPDELRLDEVGEPEVGPRDALVEVHSCGICGSDLGYLKLGGLLGPGPEPMPIGHELSGVVLEAGAEVAHVKPGDRVVVNPLGGGDSIGNGGPEGAFAPRLLVRNAAGASSIFPIPEDLPLDLAALAEPLGVGLQAVDQSRAVAGERAVVMGAGPIGLMSLVALRDRGIEEVTVVDVSERRLQIARELGAPHTIDPSDTDLWGGITDRHGTAMWMDVIPMAAPHVYIEATGHSPLIGDILSHARPGARVSIVALHREPVPVDMMTVLSKELTLVGSLAYPDDYGRTIDLLRRTDLSAAITHRFGLDDYEEAFRVARDSAVSAKVVIQPGA